MIGGILCVTAIAAVAVWRVEVPYQQWESRDGTLQITVKKQWITTYLPLFPGQSGDAPGSVYVMEKQTGVILLHKRISMVSTAADEIENYKEK